MEKSLDQHAPAYEPSFKYHDENHLMLAAYARQMLARLEEQEARRILGLGIGHQVVVRALCDFARRMSGKYTVVEGSEAIAQRLLASGPELQGAHLEVVCSLFEAFSSPEKFDAIEMGFVLEHVDDPRGVLERFRDMLASHGVLFVAVPNARSLHRQLGHAAGLLADMFQLSEHDRVLGHQHYYDLSRLERLLEETGFRVRARKGLLLKPFTTDQLGRLQLPKQAVDALITVGYELPEMCNGIYVECSLARGSNL
jgi:2-polyprenyl-3-methyl-5-hydroxy-6-metoxy-1,4-benzoquinol methylase